MNEAKSTKPNVEYIREWLEDYKASFGVAIPSAGLPTSHVIGNVEWLLAENESLKAKLKTAGICELAVDNPNLASYAKEWENRAAKAEAERDKALEVIREYREDHAHPFDLDLTPCVGQSRCADCIQADALLSKEETK